MTLVRVQVVILLRYIIILHFLLDLKRGSIWVPGAQEATTKHFMYCLNIVVGLLISKLSCEHRCGGAKPVLLLLVVEFSAQHCVCHLLGLFSKNKIHYY